MLEGLNQLWGEWSGPLFEQTKLVLFFELVYLLILIAVCLRIIYDTRSVSKTLAYLLFAIFVPVVGIVFYFSFGINYRKRKIYNKKLVIDEAIKEQFQNNIKTVNEQLRQSTNSVIRQNRDLVRLLSNKNAGNALVLPDNLVKVLINGETVFPLLIEELQKAKSHIHMEYYIYDNDVIGNQIKDILIAKAKEGIEVRFIYDDFGSKDIRRNIARELRREGVQAYPFNEIKLVALANRLNYRNHRKIVVIDGVTSFIGGINIADKYANTENTKLYWRDTHLMIKGLATQSIQQIFLSDWNFCGNQDLSINQKYFPEIETEKFNGTADVQVVSSGPDSDLPNILYSVIQSIHLAQSEVLLTTPYYIPDDSLQESLIIAALSGIKVKLLVPHKGDSYIVNLASQAYFEDLLKAGVEIYMYEKGFIHAKTFVTDRKLASVGTANLDLRSFDLNFEIAALIYDKEIAGELADAFDKDLKYSTKLRYQDWVKRSAYRKMSERLVRLISPFM